jgi:hypothetical protein
VDGQLAVFESDVDIRRLDAGKVGQQEHLVLRLENVNPWSGDHSQFAVVRGASVGVL